MAGVLQRQLTLDTSTQVLGRALLRGRRAAGVCRGCRARPAAEVRSVGIAGVAVALCVAAASGSFIAALNHTSVARVLFILGRRPGARGAAGLVTLGEPITRGTVAAMALALAGVTLMLGAPGEGSLAGDGLAFVAAFAFALMLVITRWRRDVSMARHLPFAGDPRRGLPSVRQSRRDRRRRRGLARGARHRSDRLGFALLTVGARLIPAAQVGLITLLEVVLGYCGYGSHSTSAPARSRSWAVRLIVAIVIQTRAAPPPEPGRGASAPGPALSGQNALCGRFWPAQVAAGTTHNSGRSNRSTLVAVR